MIDTTHILEEDLRKMGVQLIDRPDYFTGKNRTLTVIIDERIEYETVIFEDALSVFMSTRTLYRILDVLRRHIYKKFIPDFMYAVNKFTRMQQMAVKPHGKYFWEVAVNQISESLQRLGITLNNFGYLEYKKCCKTFGGSKGFREFMYDSINQDLDGTIPRCLYCDYCKTDRFGNRRCSKVAVIVDKPKHHSALMHIITLEKNASNYIDDILLYLEGKNCNEFLPRDTSFINRCIRVKNNTKNK